jgi:hypothetical protein
VVSLSPRILHAALLTHQLPSPNLLLRGTLHGGIVGLMFGLCFDVAQHYSRQPSPLQRCTQRLAAVAMGLGTHTVRLVASEMGGAALGACAGSWVIVQHAAVSFVTDDQFIPQLTALPVIRGAQAGAVLGLAASCAYGLFPGALVPFIGRCSVPAQRLIRGLQLQLGGALAATIFTLCTAGVIIPVAAPSGARWDLIQESLRGSLLLGGTAGLLDGLGGRPYANLPGRILVSSGCLVVGLMAASSTVGACCAAASLVLRWGDPAQAYRTCANFGIAARYSGMALGTVVGVLDHVRQGPQPL